MTKQVSCTELKKQNKEDAWPYRGAENVEMGGFCSTLMVHDGGEGQQDASIKHLDGQMVQMESAIHVPSHSGPSKNHSLKSLSGKKYPLFHQHILPRLT